jgi:hypothetical protein
MLFTCECGKSYEKKGSLNSHARFCELYKKTKQPTKYKTDNGYECECGKIFEKHQSLNSHFSHCLIHRNGKAPNRKTEGWAGWSKGKTKETSESVRKFSERLKGRPGSFLGKTHTLEQRKNLSEKRIAFLENNKDSGVKWFEVSNGSKLIKVQGTWEKAVAEWLNRQGINWDRERISYDGHRSYTPDFKIVDLNFYIEVKGWLKDRDIEKMRKVIDQTSITIKLLDKASYNRVLNDNMFTIDDLPNFQ